VIENRFPHKKQYKCLTTGAGYKSQQSSAHEPSLRNKPWTHKWQLNSPICQGWGCSKNWSCTCCGWYSRPLLTRHQKRLNTPNPASPNTERRKALLEFNLRLIKHRTCDDLASMRFLPFHGLLETQLSAATHRIVPSCISLLQKPSTRFGVFSYYDSVILIDLECRIRARGS